MAAPSLQSVRRRATFFPPRLLHCPRPDTVRLMAGIGVIGAVD